MIVCFILAGYLLLCVCIAFIIVEESTAANSSTPLPQDGQEPSTYITNTDSTVVTEFLLPYPSTQGTRSYSSQQNIPISTPAGPTLTSGSSNPTSSSVQIKDEKSLTPTFNPSSTSSATVYSTMLLDTSDVQYIVSTTILVSQAMSTATASLSQGLSVTTTQYTSALHTMKSIDTTHSSSATESSSFLLTTTPSIHSTREESSPTSTATTYATGENPLPPDATMFTSYLDTIIPPMTLPPGIATTQSTIVTKRLSVPTSTFSTITSHTSIQVSSTSRISFIITTVTDVVQLPYETSTPLVATTTLETQVTTRVSSEDTDRNLKIAVGTIGSAVALLVSAVLVLMVVAMVVQCRARKRHRKTNYKVRTPDKKSDSFRYAART